MSFMNDEVSLLRKSVSESILSLTWENMGTGLKFAFADENQGGIAGPYSNSQSRVKVEQQLFLGLPRMLENP